MERCQGSELAKAEVGAVDHQVDGGMGAGQRCRHSCGVDGFESRFACEECELAGLR